MRVVHEDEKCYRVRGADGREVTIAKSALSKATAEHVQRFAQGGVVIRRGEPPAADLPPELAEPPVISPETEHLLDPNRASTTEPTEALPTSDFGTPPAPPSLPAPPIAPTVAFPSPFPEDAPQRTPPTPNAAEASRAFQEEQARQKWLEEAALDPSKLKAAGATSVVLRPGSVKGHYPGVAPGSAPVEVVPLESPLDPGAPVITPRVAGSAMAMRVTPGSLGAKRGPDSALEKGIDLQRRGIAAEEQAKQTEAALVAEAAQKEVEQRAAARQSYEAQRTALQQRIEGVKKQVENAEIDPGRFWSSRTDGQRVSAIIGLVLGGLGAGLTRSNINPAAIMLDRAIDRDIEAQRANLGKKQALLGMYLQEGKDLDAAYGLTKADMLDMSAAQFRVAAAKMGGEKAKAEALRLSGDLEVRASQLRDESVAKDVEAQLKRAQAANLLSEAELHRAQIGVAHGQQKQQAVANEVEAALLSGREVPAQLLPFASQATRDSLIQVAPGRFARARTPEAAKKIAEVATSADELNDAIRQMRDLRKTAGREVVDGGTVAKARLLAKRAQLAIKDVGELGTLDKGASEFLDEMVTNPTAVFTRDSAVFGQLDALEDWSRARVTAVRNANMFRAPVAAPTARKVGG